ncbi:MAG TPA: DNA gyrase inhibitor YacG [Methylophilus sp.]
MSIVKKRLVNCPTCGKPCEFSPNNLYRPFCSERCQMIDLGDWANEQHRIPDAAPPSLDDD